MIDFVDVVLRSLALAVQAIVVGGVAFVIVVLRPCADVDLGVAARRVLRLVAWAAAVLALMQVGLVVVLLVELADGAAWPVAALTGTEYFRAATVRVLACVLLAVGAWRAARARAWRRRASALAVPALAAAVSVAWMSHAAARLDHRAPLLAVDTVHQLAAGVWIGGLFHLIAVGLGLGERRWPPVILARFSTMALGAVAIIVAAGVTLARIYTDGVEGLVGTSYGLMIMAKVVILAALVALGAMNFRALRRPASVTGPGHLRRFVEVELGLGMTALVVAASLTSLPVGADLGASRATVAEILTRVTPRVPSFTSPPHDALPANDPAAPRTDADRGWSEYNHHMAGLFVLVMGTLAIVEGTGRARWARHWPLVFLGMAVFLFIRDDPGDWPLGSIGFWEGMRSAEVFQHRLFVVLVVAFGIFEWLVRTKRLRAPRVALVFPLLCALGGALLLTHSHGTVNLKEEFLDGITHVPLGLLGIAAGWGRWLELRLPSSDGRLPGRLSAWALALVGVVLLLYREH